MDPDSHKNPTNSAENGPSVNQPGSGYHQTPNPSEPRKGGNPNNEGNKKSGNTTSGAGHSGSLGGGKGQQGPTHGQFTNLLPSAGGWYNIKKSYKNWCEKTLRISHPKHQYDCLLGALADRLGLYRPALVFAVGLGGVTNWSLNDRILHWSENLIRLFGLGLKWEYFDSYAKGLQVPIPNHGDYTYVPEVKRRQVIGARLFFQDLLSLVTYDSLSEEGKRLYCMVARNLLTSIWA